MYVGHDVIIHKHGFCYVHVNNVLFECMHFHPLAYIIHGVQDDFSCQFSHIFEIIIFALLLLYVT